MIPHCDYCHAQLQGKNDLNGRPCDLCIDRLNAKIQENKNFYFMECEKLLLVIPKEFYDSIFLSDKLTYATRSLTKKIRSFSKQFIK